MAVGGVQHQHVDRSCDQGGRPGLEVGAHAHRRCHPQPAEVVLGGVGVLDGLGDVLDGDEALELEVVVDDQQLLDLVLAQHLAGHLERGPDRHGDQVGRRHEVAYRAVEVGLEAQVAVGEDAEQQPVWGHDRHPADAVAAHELLGVVQGRVTTEGDRVDDHPRLGALHLADHLSLLLDRHLLVDDADAAVARHRDRHRRLGDRVHGRGDQRGVQRHPPGEARGQVDLAGQHGAVRRHQEHVVEGQRSGHHLRLPRRGVRRQAVDHLSPPFLVLVRGFSRALEPGDTFLMAEYSRAGPLSRSTALLPARGAPAAHERPRGAHQRSGSLTARPERSVGTCSVMPVATSRSSASLTSR